MRFVFEVANPPPKQSASSVFGGRLTAIRAGGDYLLDRARSITV